MRLGLLGRNYSLTLDLPAPRWLLDVAIECADCAVEEAEVRVLECPKLPELARPPWLVAELDDCVQLADRLNALADWELTALRGVFTSRHPATVEEVLTMTQGLERVPVVRGIGNDYRLGQFVLDNDLNDTVSQLPPELLDCLDLSQLGRIQREQDGGVYVDGDYVGARQYEMPEQVTAEREVFLLRLEHEGESFWVGLPMGWDEEEAFSARLGVRYLTECTCLEFRSNIPEIREAQFRGMECFATFNHISAAYLAMTPGEQADWRTSLADTPEQTPEELLQSMEKFHMEGGMELC